MMYLGHDDVSTSCIGSVLEVHESTKSTTFCKSDEQHVFAREVVRSSASELASVVADLQHGRETAVATPCQSHCVSRAQLKVRSGLHALRVLMNLKQMEVGASKSLLWSLIVLSLITCHPAAFQAGLAPEHHISLLHGCSSLPQLCS